MVFVFTVGGDGGGVDWRDTGAGVYAHMGAGHGGHHVCGHLLRGGAFVALAR